MRCPKATKAEFGRIALLRLVCPICNEPALVIGGKMACCGSAPHPPENFIKKKESQGNHRREHLTEKEKSAIISRQSGLCFYCQNPFGTPAYHPGRKKVIVPTIHFDHFVCWDFSRDTSVGNMVAACSICNLIKGSKIFANVDDARIFIKRRIGLKGYEFHLEQDAPWSSLAALESRRNDATSAPTPSPEK